MLLFWIQESAASLLFQTLQHVVGDFGVQHPVLQSSEQLVFEVRAGDKQPVFANRIATIGMH
ncbi:MAG: hypothetical protein WA817_24380 [Candidatus Acidiferrum sp.]